MLNFLSRIYSEKRILIGDSCALKIIQLMRILVNVRDNHFKEHLPGHPFWLRTTVSTPCGIELVTESNPGPGRSRALRFTSRWPGSTSQLARASVTTAWIQVFINGISIICTARRILTLNQTSGFSKKLTLSPVACGNGADAFNVRSITIVPDSDSFSTARSMSIPTLARDIFKIAFLKLFPDRKNQFRIRAIVNLNYNNLEQSRIKQEEIWSVV